jgi:hypothetical protein
MIRLQDGVGAENLIRSTDQGRCTKRNVGNCRATYVLHSVAPAVRQDPDGDLEILVSNPIWLSAPTGSVCVALMLLSVRNWRAAEHQRSA